MKAAADGTITVEGGGIFFVDMEYNTSSTNDTGKVDAKFINSKHEGYWYRFMFEQSWSSYSGYVAAIG